MLHLPPSNCLNCNPDPELAATLADMPRSLIFSGMLAGIPEFVREYNRRLDDELQLEEILKLNGISPDEPDSP